MNVRNTSSIVQRRMRAENVLEVRVEGAVYAFDSSVISLCLSLFRWAKFKYGKSAVKLHTLYDVRTQIPCVVVITPALVNDMNGMDYIHHEAGSYYIFDRGCNDYARLFKIHQADAFFVIRADNNLRFKRIYSTKGKRDKSIRADQTGVFITGNSPKRYPDKIRRIKYYDAENDQYFVFLTNDFESDAKTIADLYRLRRGVELFFKWIKHL